MPSKDLFHNNVVTALIKDGWKITDDPLHLRYGKIDLYVDLGADNFFAAEKEKRKIAVEIKSFLAPSFISEFHAALGQYINYRIALEDIEPGRELFMAISDDVYKDNFYIPLIQKSIMVNKLNLIIYNPEDSELVQWIR